MFRIVIILLCLFYSVVGQTQSNGPTVGTKLVSLSGKDLLTGKMIDIQFSESPGYTLLHFWQQNSDSCINDLPLLLALEKDYHKKIVLYGFPYETKAQVPILKEKIVKYKLNWAQLLQYKQLNAAGANVIDVLQVDQFPTYILLDQEGVIIVRSPSLLDVRAVLKNGVGY